MCDHCRPRALSRRGFLRLSAAAGASALLGACGAPAAGELRGRVHSPSPLPAASPAVAGTIASEGDARIAIAAPVGERTLAMAETARTYDHAGHRLKGVPSGAGVLVWIEEPTGREQQATVLQQLPRLAATDEIPEALPAQATPTGETRPLGPLSLITRAGWGAAPPQWSPDGEAPFDAKTNPAGYLVYPDPLAEWLTTLVVHHAALEFHHGPREIQRLHVLSKGFADVGYHFFIDGLGQLYEGRPPTVRGAHTGGHNTGTIGVCLLGNFEVIPALQRQLDTLKALAITLGARYGLTHLAGHRDFQPEATVCPGENLWAALPAVTEATGLAYGTEGYRPPSW